MERLTKRTPAGVGILTDCGAKPRCRCCKGVCRAQDEANTRLADYEDTGLTPEEVNALKLYAMGAAVAAIEEFDGVPIARLQELAKAEKAGRLAVVPAPGDKAEG